MYLQPTFVILSDVVSFALILNVTQEKLAVFIQSVTVRIVFSEIVPVSCTINVYLYGLACLIVNLTILF